MREVKFRAWDKKRKKMMWRFAIDPDGKVLGWNGMVEKWENVKQGYILMQLIGLKDKNGREIYESDIVQFWDEEISKVRRELVQYIAPSFIVMGTGDKVYIQDTTIIGNVHENGELLGEATKD